MTIRSRVKPKEIMVNLPAAHLFATEDEIPALAAAINTILSGKSKIKCEHLGLLNGQYVGLFYIKRDHESQEIHDEFIRLIEQEEMAGQAFLDAEETRREPEEQHNLCLDCDELMMLHQKGLYHCTCGCEWDNGKCESQ